MRGSGRESGMSKSESPQRGLFESERRFRLLVEGVIDYAIYMLDPNGHRHQLECRRQAHQGLRRRGGRRPAFRDVLFARRIARPDCLRASLATAREKGKFEAEGWRLRKDGTQFLASVVIDADLRGRRTGRLRQDHPRHHRTAARPPKRSGRASGTSVCWCSGVTDYALYMLDPDRHRHQLERRRASASRATRRRKSSASTFPDSTPSRRPGRRPPGARAAASRSRHGRYEEEGWRVRKDGTFFWASVVIDPIRDDDGELIGFAKITRDITERREAQQNMEKMQRATGRSRRSSTRWGN